MGCGSLNMKASGRGLGQSGGGKVAGIRNLSEALKPGFKRIQMLSCSSINLKKKTKRKGTENWREKTNGD